MSLETLFVFYNEPSEAVKLEFKMKRDPLQPKANSGCVRTPSSELEQRGPVEAVEGGVER